MYYEYEFVAYCIITICYIPLLHETRETKVAKDKAIAAETRCKAICNEV